MEKFKNFGNNLKVVKKYVFGPSLQSAKKELKLGIFKLALKIRFYR